jgi:hypothetical protein
VKLHLSDDIRVDEMVVLSTAHLTSEDAKTLEQMSNDGQKRHPFIEIFDYGEGYVIWLHSKDFQIENDLSAFSTTFRHLIDSLPDTVRWLRFDCDADKSPLFATHNW